jgi:ABC-2 type transport system permease protein
MRKYWAFCRANIQVTLTYRGPILIWLFSSVIGLIAITAVWFSASTGPLIGGYTKNELISYYLFSLFLGFFVSWLPFYGTRDEIKDGVIVVTALTKPFSYYWKRFFEELGWHMVSVWVALAGSLIVGYFLKDYLVFKLDPLKALFIILAVCFCIILTFSLSLCMGLLAFWFTEISAIESIFWISRSLLGGQTIPLSFIPDQFQTITRLLPFRYMFSFPLEIYFNKLTTLEIFHGLIIQTVWAVILFLLYRLMWQKGRKAYTAFGH